MNKAKLLNVTQDNHKFFLLKTKKNPNQPPNQVSSTYLLITTRESKPSRPFASKSFVQIYKACVVYNEILLKQNDS